MSPAARDVARRQRWVSGFLLVLLLVLCGAAVSCTDAALPVQTITGAGATAPYPLYSRWTAAYTREHPNVRINYVSLGSGAGIRQVSQRLVDFGASDVPLTAEQAQETRVPLVQVPVLLGAVVPVYSLPGFRSGVRFAPEVLAAIYLGEITRWDDPRLARDNPGLALPAQAIVPVYRSDGAGTTALFTRYLNRGSAKFAQVVGSSTSVRWPCGVGAKGSEGVVGVLRDQPYSLAYVEPVYATQSGLSTGMVRNRTGAWVAAGPASLQAAAGSGANAAPAPDLNDNGNPAAYPIASYTWLLLPRHPAGRERNAVLNGFAAWVLDRGQDDATAMGYAPLPGAVARYARQLLETKP